ncbi:MAG: hypothetical protein PHU24_05270 [Sphaerochaetaceae bacterium]|nr:hypothetical protein [Sphaerochaetaceae bacterium]NLO61233.1 hypothetical protein [Spirochaetales bacterium]MDD2405847.1 hypothetical protein [Sphaerochaetaceae bacterium]MDD4260360.1 hypothetical protein [Sphaerochaetaceae bacterium]MDD4762983.1 hypothetical protein [Sphaerochaetaceae bacterium]
MDQMYSTVETPVSTVLSFTRLDVGSLLKTHKPHLAPWIPKFLIRKLEQVIHLNFINDFMEAHCDDEPEIFLSALIEEFDIRADFYGYQRFVDCLTKRPIIVANHPLGGVESLLLMDEVVKVHGNVHMIVKSLLTAIKPLAPFFVSIPRKNDRQVAMNLLDVFHRDVPILIFPAGYCSRPLSNKDIYDLCWSKSFVKLARINNRPIVPIHISGENSKKFYRYSTLRRKLGIKESLESILLVDEMLRKRHSHLKMTVGDILRPQLFGHEISDTEWAARIREYVWILGKNGSASFDPSLQATLPIN